MRTITHDDVSNLQELCDLLNKIRVEVDTPGDNSVIEKVVNLKKLPKFSDTPYYNYPLGKNFHTMAFQQMSWDEKFWLGNNIWNYFFIQPRDDL